MTQGLKNIDAFAQGLPVLALIPVAPRERLALPFGNKRQVLVL